MRHRIIRIIKIIIGISATAGTIAGVTQLLEKKTNNHQPRGIYERFFKRILDVFLSTGALIVFSPVICITAILVRIKHGSPVVYTQERPGKDEKIFKIYKFRTMTDEKDSNGELLPDEERITKLGRALRRSSLDELLELVNIIKGDMSIIGPRPLLVRYLSRYTEEQRHRHDVTPGLTGYAQAHGRNAVSWEDKFAMDIWYTKNITFRNDVRIFLDTIRVVLNHDGISSKTSATMEEFMGTPMEVKTKWAGPNKM